MLGELFVCSVRESEPISLGRFYNELRPDFQLMK